MKLSISPEVFVCARYVYSQIYTKKEMISPIFSPIKSISEIQKEFETMEEEIDLEMDNMEREFEKEERKKEKNRCWRKDCQNSPMKNQY